MTRQLLSGALAAIAAVAVVSASDPVGVYAKVDRVTFEPNESAPTAVQVWGVFSIAKPNNGNDYEPAARGYLYYTTRDNPELARREWADLERVAGTGEIVAFGSRWRGTPPRVRAANEKPENPDPYAVNVGLTKVTGRAEYAPIRAILDAR